MKKLLALMSLAVVAGAAHATVLYDTYTPAFNTPSFYTGAGNQRAGDNFLVSSAGAGNHWKISEIDFQGVNSVAAGTYTNVSVQINVWNGAYVSGVATDPAYTSLAGTTTVNFGSITTTAVGIWNFTVTGLAIDLASAPVSAATGYAIEYKWTNGGPGTFSNLYDQVASSAAGSSWSNGFGLDTSNNGVIAQNEFYNLGAGWVNGNLRQQVVATSVPEPATMAVLGLGAAALLRRRSKKA